MKFACPNPGCGAAVGLGDRACPRCGVTFGPFTLLALFWRGFRLWLVRITSLQCPACYRASPFLARACPHCRQPITFTVAVEVALTPLRDRYEQAVDNAGPKAMRRIQWLCFQLSLVLLWYLLGYTAKHADEWIGQALLSVVYLAVFGLLAAVLVPRSVWVSFLWRTSRLTKLTVVVNYFSVLLLVQSLIGAWKERATVLAGLFAVSWLASWVLCHLIWPQFIGTVTILTGGGAGFDTSDRQGRRVE